MNKYQVMLQGENFFIEHEGAVVKHGFIATRFVEAANPEEAEIAAVTLIKNDETLVELVQPDATSEPMIYLEELYELESFEGINTPGHGYSFYIDKKPWWKFWK